MGQKSAAGSAPRDSHTRGIDGWETGCAFPEGVVHDHGYEGCHQATARLTAQMAVVAFLQGIAQGRQVRVCENAECGVALFTTTATGTQVAACPACAVEAASS